MANHTGVYVNRTEYTALFTILKEDGTCGMFLMPNGRIVFWLGFTTYTVEGNKLKFKIQNSNPNARPEDPTNKSKAGKVSNTTGALTKTADNKDDATEQQYIEATLIVGNKYVQHAAKGDTDFEFVTSDVSYWNENDWEKIGEARELEGRADFDTAHEIRVLSVKTIRKYGNIWGW